MLNDSLAEDVALFQGPMPSDQGPGLMSIPTAPMFLVDLPVHPGPLVQQWLEEARAKSGMPNWNAMMLATVSRGGASGGPSVRAVLLKEHDPQLAAFTFFTNYRSRKGRDIAANPHVSAAFYWDALNRQMRLEGVARPVPADVSDAYFATRPRESQIGAWASAQSEPVERYEDLIAAAAKIEAQYEGRAIPRPPHWGGYQIVADAIEFWVSKPGRVHERIVYVRDQAQPSEWSRRWLSP